MQSKVQVYLQLGDLDSLWDHNSEVGKFFFSLRDSHLSTLFEFSLFFPLT